MGTSSSSRRAQALVAANGRGLSAKLANTVVLPAQTTQARAMQEFFVGFAFG
jgi:hypothetical protein